MPICAMARSIALNAKMRRTGICGAAETLLVDRACAATHLAPIVRDLLDAGCEVRGDAAVQRRRCARARRRPKQDWYTEYLDAIIAARVVDGRRCGHRAHRALRLGAHRVRS